ncbi:putative pentatricopeptide repeat-containing protein At5g43820 [Impatiens glandulifera]|uniref:putative pentatricopeptide repeat-containing protein At5g43820 n=1 Tax=Impatiens glandulifera TaxID=253017 RepID=UPI001FB17BFC|nr:putative pentatricopeptide repeat-containing protein At5g43820 [Impatiens glandulifera]
MVVVLCKRITAFFQGFDRIRYYRTTRLFSSLTFPSSITADEPLSDEINIRPCIHESHILAKLSNLLPIHQSISTTFLNPSVEDNSMNQLETRSLDGFLSPEDKLRGIFLHKLTGKAAIEHALTNANIEVSIDIVSRVLDRGSLSGESMVIFFKWFIKQKKISNDLDSYHIILKALGRRKFFKHMLDVLHDMNLDSITLNSNTLTILIDSFTRAHQVSKAVQLFENLEDFGGKCDTVSFNVLLLCLSKRSHVGAANSLLNKMKGKIPFNLTSYNVIISGWAKLGRISEMELVLKTMTDDGHKPDCFTFSYIISGFGRAGRMDEALKIFNNIDEADTIVYNAMISNFIAVGKFDEFMKCYMLILNNGCEPNMDTYRMMICGLLKSRKVADAVEMFNVMLDRGNIPSMGDITLFIEPLCSYGPPYAALLIYNKVKKKGFKLSLKAYKLLIARLSRLGKCGLILNIWDDMEKAGYSSDAEVYECVVDGLCKVGQLQNAVLVVEESLRKGFCPSRVVWGRLRDKLLGSDKVDCVRDLFLKIKDGRKICNAKRNWRAMGWHV